MVKRDQMFTTGSNVQPGKGLHQRKAEKRVKAKNISEDVVLSSIEHGVEETALAYGISATAVSKYVAKALKKRDDLDIKTFIGDSRVTEIQEYLFAANSTSIKRLLLGKSDLTEWELRLVKANIEKNRGDNWDF